MPRSKKMGGVTCEKDGCVTYWENGCETYLDIRRHHTTLEQIFANRRRR